MAFLFVGGGAGGATGGGEGLTTGDAWTGFALGGATLGTVVVAGGGFAAARVGAGGATGAGRGACTADWVGRGVAAGGAIAAAAGGRRSFFALQREGRAHPSECEDDHGRPRDGNERPLALWLGAGRGVVGPRHRRAGGGPDALERLRASVGLRRVSEPWMRRLAEARIRRVAEARTRRVAERSGAAGIVAGPRIASRKWARHPLARQTFRVPEGHGQRVAELASALEAQGRVPLQKLFPTSGRRTAEGPRRSGTAKAPEPR